MTKLYGAFKYTLLCALLCGCGMSQYRTNMLSNSLRQGNVDSVYQVLIQHEVAKKDQAQQQLNLGMVQFLKADYRASIEHLQLAKNIMEQLQSTSVVENVQALSINEAMRSFVAAPSEFVFLHQLLALNYLAKNDLAAARVEMLQADTRMNAYNSAANNEHAELSSGRYLAGVIYELSGEYDSALVSYRKAYRSNLNNKRQIPVALQRALLKTTAQMGLMSEHQKYTELFGIDYKKNSSQTELAVIYYNGVVGVKHSNVISVYSYKVHHYVSLALPAYSGRVTPPINAFWSLKEQEKSGYTQQLDSMDKNVRQDLNAQMGKLTAQALARAVVKHNISANVQRNNQDSSSLPLLALLGNLAVNITEYADTRSWNTLPAAVEVDRASIKEIVDTLQIDGKSVAIKPKKGRLNLVFGHNLSSQLIFVQAR